MRGFSGKQHLSTSRTNLSQFWKRYLVTIISRVWPARSPDLNPRDFNGIIRRTKSTKRASIGRRFEGKHTKINFEVRKENFFL
jgi:hypothetical protein